MWKYLSSPLSLLNFRLSDLFLPYANDKYFKGTRNTSKFVHLCQSDLALHVPIVLRKPSSFLFSVSVSLFLWLHSAGRPSVWDAKRVVGEWGRRRRGGSFKTSECLMVVREGEECMWQEALGFLAFSPPSTHKIHLRLGACLWKQIYKMIRYTAFASQKLVCNTQRLSYVQMWIFQNRRGRLLTPGRAERRERKRWSFFLFSPPP